MQLSKILFLVIACISIAITSSPPQEPKVVEAESVSLKTITQTIRLFGTIKAKYSQTLNAKTTGTLDYASKAGDRILKGTLIAKLENEDLEKNYNFSVQAEKIAEEQHNRVVLLAKSNTVSKQAMEDSQTKWIGAQKTLALAKIEWDKTRFIAPFDGVVGVFKTLEGAQVQTGDKIVTFYDPFTLIVEFDIPACYVGELKDGQSVIIGDKTFQVPHIQKNIDPDTHMIPASLDFISSPEEKIVIGSTIDLDLVIQEHRDVVVIPYEAVFLRDGKTFVYVVEENKATLRPVTLGIREKDTVEITKGLSPEDVFITKNTARLYPTIAVKVIVLGVL